MNKLLRSNLRRTRKLQNKGTYKLPFTIHSSSPISCLSLKDEENSSQTVGEFESALQSLHLLQMSCCSQEKKKKKMFIFKCLCSKHRLVESQQIPICFLFASEKLSWKTSLTFRLLNSLVPIHTIIAPKRIPFSSMSSEQQSVRIFVLLKSKFLKWFYDN